MRSPTSRAACRSACDIAFGSSYGVPSGVVVQVVELPDGGDAGRDHLAVRRTSELVVAVRVEPGCDGVHLLAPGPERASLALRAAAERAVERVAVTVGQTRNRQACKAIRSIRGLSCSTRVKRPSSTSTTTPSSSSSPVQARSSQYVVTSPAPPACPRAPRRRRGSRPSRRTRSGACETPVGLRTNSIAVGMPAAESTPASWPRHGRDHRPVARRRDALGQLVVEVHRGRDRLRSDLERRAVTFGALVREAVDLRQHRVEGVRRLCASVEPGGDPRRDGVGAVGVHVDASERRPLPGDACLLVRRERRHRVAQHRVVAVLHARGAGVVRLAGEVEAPATVRPDPARRGDGHVAVHEVAALLDVQLDEGADAVEHVAVAASRHSTARPRRTRRPGRVSDRARSHGMAPVARREPRQARPNREPSSSTKTPTPIGRDGVTPRSRSTSSAASALTTPSGPSYAPPSGTESRCDPVSSPGPVAPIGSPPGDDVAEAVASPRRARGPRTARGTMPSPRAPREASGERW